MAARVSHTQKCRFGIIIVKDVIIKESLTWDPPIQRRPWVAEFSTIECYKKIKRENQIRKACGK